MTGGSVAGVVLAAGRSSRLGRPKQLLDLGGKPLLRVTLDNALASTLDRVVLVLGDEADAIAHALGPHAAAVVVNHRFAAGQATSVVAGIGALTDDAAAALLMLGDQPGIDPAIIDAILDAWRTDDAPIVAPVYGGTLGNPVLFRRDLFPELLRLSGDEGARRIVRARAADVVHVPIDLPAPPPDIDTEADYRRLLTQLGWAQSGESVTAPRP